MRTLVLGLIGILGVGLVGFGIYQQSKSSSPVEPSPKTVATMPSPTTESVMVEMDSNPSQTEPPKQQSRYLAYSPETVAGVTTPKLVLFFYASWCPTCRPADADIQAKVDDIPSNVTIIRVNYNDSETDQAEKNLARDYQVTYQHTFVQVDAEGREVTRWNGGNLDKVLTTIK